MRSVRTVVTTVLLALATLLSGVPATTAVPAATASPSATAISSATAMPSAAPAPYGPAIPLLTGCGTGQPADGTIAADGTVRGYATCDLNGPRAIHYVRYRGGTAFHQLTPYRGMVLQAAWDGLNNTYLLFTHAGPDPTTEQLFIGKRLDNTGQYAPATLLATTHPSGPDRGTREIQATLVASASRWWAIWTEPTTGVSQPATYSLFQRHTLLGVQPRTRISYPAIGVADSAPSLAYSPGLLTALWGRAPDQGPGNAFLMLGQSKGTRWGARPVWSASRNILKSTDLISYAGIRYATWLTTWQVVVAANVLSTFYPRGYSVTNGADSTVAVSGQNLFLMWWTGPGMGGSQLFLLERQAGVWSSPVVITGAVPATRVLAQGGKGRLLYWDSETLMLRIQN